MDNDPEKRGRPLERSLSYSEAIRGSNSARSSFEIPRMIESDVYTNEELKKQYRISQTYVEGKEIMFPAKYESTDFTDSQSDDEEHVKGLVMKIDIETSEGSPKYSSPIYASEASTRQMVSDRTDENIYDTIDVEESIYVPETSSPPPVYSSPYSRRKKGQGHRRWQGRPRRSRRVVFKSGEENVPVRSNIPAKSIKYMRDIVNTVINSKWRFLILFMIIAHFLFWLFFASIWLWVTSAYREDIGDGKDHCVTGTSSFAGLLMMAVETQMTIGYGTRFPNEECPEAIIVMVLEIIAGTALSGGLTSLLFTKLVRPNRHVSSVGFSRKATVCLRDGQLCLQFRVWDLMNVHMITSTITAYMLKPIRTLEGEMHHNYIHQLKLKQAKAFLLWPITVVHVIDRESPLYDLSAQDMMDYRFEIVVCLTGSSKNMGTLTQSRTSYLSKEIIWGYRFENVLQYSKKADAYVIDTEKLNSVEQVETPLCSASKLKEFENRSREDYQSPTDIYLKDSESTTLENSSLNQDSGSVVSSPTFNRNGTQRSLGWNFRKFYTVDSIQEQMGSVDPET